jgi:hypothetical protein
MVLEAVLVGVRRTTSLVQLRFQLSHLKHQLLWRSKDTTRIIDKSCRELDE